MKDDSKKKKKSSTCYRLGNDQNYETPSSYVNVLGIVMSKVGYVCWNGVWFWIMTF